MGNKFVNSQSSIVNTEPSHFESLYPSDSRFDELERITNFIKQGKSVQLVGLPGVGRSNTLGFLSYNKHIREKHLGENQKWFHFVLCDFSEIRKKPLRDAIKFLFLRLSESLQERKMLKSKDSSFAAEEAYKLIDPILKQSISSNDEMVLFQGLKRAIDILCIEKELTVVFLFDRFEEYISELTPEFFANLKILRNRAKYRFSAVFSVSRPLDDLIEPALFADYYEFLADNIVYLPIMDKQGMDFRISYLEKISGKKFDDKTIKEVLNLTGGHGKLTRLCLEQLTTNSSQLTKVELESYLVIIKSIQGALYEIWMSLLPEEKQLLTTNKLTANTYLEKTGLTKNGEVSIPLFKDFISTMKQSGSETIVFDEKTNDIKRGEVSLSEALTSSEFKMLKFLINNPDKIIEREEIIKAVWQDEKTTEGVTDQALDQLIFRLRKKIEEDPNNPHHIQTVKGRGVRFSA